MAILHEIRTDGFGKTKKVKLTARRAIIEFCKECVGWDKNEVRKCTAKLCPLYPFRTWDKPESTTYIVP